MRILHVHTDLVGGGIERVLTTLATRTRADAVGICWCPANHPEPQASTLREIRAAGVEVYRIPPPFLSPLYPLRLRGLVARLRPDVLHLHGATVGVVGALVGRRLRVPAVIYTEHLEHAAHAGWLRRARELTAGLPHWTVFVSERARREAVESGPLRRIADRCSVIHNGIDLSPFATADRSARAEVRDELGLAADAVVLGCVGLLWRAKGQEQLIRALAAIPEAERPVALLVGSGEDEPRLLALAGELDVAASMRFLGWRNDVPRLLGAMDLYAQPSVSEAFGLTVVEAAAAELPIVASEVGGIPEIIEHGRSGLLVPPGDPHALAAAIRRLISDPGEAGRLAGNARRAALTEFSAETMARAHEELYAGLLSDAV